MAASVSNPALLGHRVIPETRPRMAKADLRKAEMDDHRRRIGAAVARAIALRGWTLKECAAAVGRDERQIARWCSGDERPQLDAIRAVESLRAPMLQALSEAFGGDVEITIRIGRSA